MRRTRGQADDISRARVVGENDGLPVTDCDRRVPLHKQARQGPTDDVAAPDDSDLLTFDWNAEEVEQLDAALRSARPKGRKPHVETPRIRRGDAINILER